MPRPRAPRFRRTPFLVMYWSRDGLVFENYRTRRRIAAGPVAAGVLHCFDRWRPLRYLAARFPEATAAELRRAVVQLVRHTLLERSAGRRPAAARGETRWEAWDPHAGFFHFGTRDVPFTPHTPASLRALRRLARLDPVPPYGKRYARALRRRLPAPRVAGEFPGVLLARRSWRRFGRRPLSLAELGTLLGLTFGVQGWLPDRGWGRLALKTSPSGGALHPLEAYVVVRRVTGLPAGIYHYDSAGHRLERLRRGATQKQIASFLPGQPWSGGAAAMVLLTAVFARPQWKYRFARAYRVLLAEAGHFAQTFCLVATWLGLAPFCTMALADSRIERALGLDGVSEGVLYAAGAGALPARRGNPHLPD